MRNNIAAAIFDDCDHAEKAINELRESGVPNDAISVVQLHDEDKDSDRGDSDGRTETVDTGDNKASGTTKGILAGGTVGAIAGLGALLIPGIGPFIAGGALASTLGVAGSAAVASGALGAAAGGLTGALVDYGFDKEHAEYYEKRIRDGAVFVAVDTSENPSAFAPSRAILRAAGGESADASEPTREDARA
ncbi:MAG: hypothetical protein H0W39_09010 [Sphingomonas sp.]|nr:hypothetical protein [Sphingomonas sp.]